MLALLLVAEIIIIGVYFCNNFSQYLTVVATLLCLPLAYFIYQYLKLTLRVDHQEVKCY